MGDAWPALAETVRRKHGAGRPVHGKGLFSVTRGPGRIGLMLAIILRMPPEARSVATTLTITPTIDGERWNRNFGGWRLSSTQFVAAENVLAERIGIIEFRFRLEVDDGALSYVQCGALLRFGRVSLSLPSWLAPRVRAREEPRDEWTHVTVSVELPLAGRIIAYDGLLSLDDDKP